VSNPIIIEDRAGLAKIVGLGILVLHVTSEYAQGAPERATHVGAITALTLNRLGEAEGETKIWMKDRPEPIVIPRLGAANETKIEIAYQLVSGL
jgi:hypothetical protein